MSRILFNQLQLAMIDFDSKIVYKKGIKMPVNYLSRNHVDAHQRYEASYDHCRECNNQAEKIAGYLSLSVNQTTLDWEVFLAPLIFSYNSSFH